MNRLRAWLLFVLGSAPVVAPRIGHGLLRVLATIGAWTFVRFRIFFAGRGLLGKGLTIAVVAYGVAYVLAHLGLDGVARQVGQMGATVLSLVLAAGFMRLIWTHFTQPRRVR